MSQPVLDVLGIYRVRTIDEELRAQLYQYYFHGNAVRDRSVAVREFIDQCIPLVLFELQLENLDDRFSVSDFEQPPPEMPHSQVAYGKVILAPDGVSVLNRKPFCARGLRSGRLAFYFHFYQPREPMRWTYGVFRGPAVEEIPARLGTLVPYSPVD